MLGDYVPLLCRVAADTLCGAAHGALTDTCHLRALLKNQFFLSFRGAKATTNLHFG
jgi:hypothetical protein